MTHKKDQPTFSFRFFPNLHEAEAFQDFLFSNGIESIIQEHSGALSKEFFGDSPHYKFELLIHEDARKQAEIVQTSRVMEDLDDIDRSHFLFDYSNDELIAILIEKHEWNEMDVLLSQKILKERGLEIHEEELELKRKQRLEMLAQPDSNQMGWVIFGYISIVLMPFVGSILGFALWKSQKRLPNGVKVPQYSESVCMHGKIIAILSTISLILQLLFKIGLSFW